MNNLMLFVNEKPVFEYDRNTVLNDEQLGFVDKMDKDMDRGIKIQGESIATPDSRQRATFVAMNLIKALQQENQASASVSCAYLSTRMPALSAVHVSDDEGTVKVELMEE